MKKGKRYTKNTQFYDRSNHYSINDAYDIIKKMSPAKFSESIDVSLLIKQDTKNSIIKSNIILPHSNGKKNKILLLTTNGDDISLKSQYDVEHIGGPACVKDIMERKHAVKYNYVITTPDMFPQLKTIAKILGPKGLMPNIKNGTISNDINDAINNIYNGKINIKSNKEGSINVSIGRSSFTYEQLYENIKALYNKILQIKLPNMKKLYIKKISISTTMSPGIKLNVNNFK